MRGDLGHGEADLIAYDRSELREGRFEDLKAGTRRLVEAVESRTSQLIAYGCHLDDEALEVLERKSTSMKLGASVTVHEPLAGFARGLSTRT